MSSAIGLRTEFYHSDDGITYTALAQVLSVNGPNLSADTVDVTNNDSPNGWREFIPGLKDGGEIEVVLVFDPNDATFVTLRDYLGTSEFYRVEWPQFTSTSSGDRVSVGGIVTGVEIESETEDRLEATVTVKVSGAPTWAAIP